MTDMPKIGILCCGKNSEELSHSVFCSGSVTKIFKESGYLLGGYHTCITNASSKDSMKLCTEKLYHLCFCSDVVVTIGSDGFDKNDRIPEITEKLCEEKTEFFTSHLCGNSNISNYSSSFLHKKTPKKYMPTKGTSGICCGCLVLNIRADRDFISELLPTIMPMINFAVDGITQKNTANCLEIFEKMNRESEQIKKTFGSLK